jgi:hypothetical protein
MDEPLSEEGGYHLFYPVWLVVHRIGTVKSLMRGRSKIGEVFMPIFTDPEGAEEFRQSIPPQSRDKWSVVRIPDPVGLLGILAILESEGFSHVTIDPRKVSQRAASYAITHIKANIIQSINNFGNR